MTTPAHTAAKAARRLIALAATAPPARLALCHTLAMCDSPGGRSLAGLVASAERSN